MCSARKDFVALLRAADSREQEALDAQAGLVSNAQKRCVDLIVLRPDPPDIRTLKTYLLTQSSPKQERFNAMPTKLRTSEGGKAELCMVVEDLQERLYAPF